LLKMGNNISTDEILPAGARALPFRSNIPQISEFAFTIIDESFPDRALRAKKEFGGHIVVAGENYAQGSSREHAALAPRYLGQVAVIAKSYARIGWQNLINFGILPLEFVDPDDYNTLDQDDVVQLKGIKNALKYNQEIIAQNLSKKLAYLLSHSMSKRQVDLILSGSVINYFKLKKLESVSSRHK
jgi:aconitate hydratase